MRQVNEPAVGAHHKVSARVAIADLTGLLHLLFR
jgi:hypothetical protein